MERNIIKAALSLSSSSIIVQALNFISQILLMRSYSVSEYGTYSLTFEGLAMCNMIVSGAFRNFYIKEINNEVGLDALLPYQLIYGSLWCIISTIVVGVMLSFDIYLIFFMSLSTVLSSIILPIWVELLVQGKRKKIIIRDFCYALLTFLLISFSVFCYLLKINGIVLILLSLNAVLAILFFLDIKRFKLIFNLKNIGLVGGSIIPFFAIFIVNTFYNKIGVTFLNHFSTLDAVGIYLATFKFINPLFFIQGALISSVLPKFKSNKNFEFDTKFFCFFAVPSLALSLLLPLFLPTVISIFGLHKYTLISHYMIFASPIIFVSSIYGALSNYISVTGGQSIILKTNIAGVVVYLSLLFLSFFLGAKSIIIELCMSFFVITESVVCMIYYFVIHKKNKVTILFLISPIAIILYQLALLIIE